MKRCVIFDLDGTLADTSGDLLAAANAAFDRIGSPARLDPASAGDRAVALTGARPMLRLGLSRLGEVDEDLVDAGFRPLLDAYGADIASETRFYPGALDAVGRLRARGDAVGICTNKPEGLTLQLLDALGVGSLFDGVVGADTLAVSKPDPEHFWETVRRCDGDRARCLLVGDTATDRKTATAANVPCVLVTFAPDGHSVADLKPDALLHDYADFESVVDPLLG